MDAVDIWGIALFSCMIVAIFLIAFGPLLCFKLGKRWAITLYDIDIQVWRRYWSRDKAMREAQSRNLARIHFSMDPDWNVREITNYREYRTGSPKGL